MTEQNEAIRKPKRPRKPLTIQERLARLIEQAKNDPFITNSSVERDNLRNLIWYVNSGDAFTVEIKGFGIIDQCIYSKEMIPTWEMPATGEMLAALEMLETGEMLETVRRIDYGKCVEPRGTDVDTHVLATYLDISAETLKQAIRDEAKIPGWAEWLPRPLPIENCDEIFIVKFGGKGKGNSHQFRRCTNEVFDMLDHLLGFRPGIECVNIKENYGNLTIREILLKAQAMRNKADDLIDWMLPLMTECDVFATTEYGLIIPDKSNRIQRIFRETKWAAKEKHVLLLRLLRYRERMPWKTFESQGLGDCTGLRWHALVFDLQPSRHLPFISDS